jgi:hypothetical protein
MFQSLHALVTSSKEETFPLIWDSGSSVCISNNRDDFLTYSSTVGDLVKAKKLGNFVSGQASVAGEGYVLWYVPSARGTYLALKLPAAHIPEAKFNLVSTQLVFDTYGERFVCEGDGRLEGVEGDPLRPAVIVPRNRHSNLLISMATRMPLSSPNSFCVSILCSISLRYSQSYANLLLHWHQKLGHMSMAKAKFLLSTGVLAQSVSTKHLHC